MRILFLAGGSPATVFAFAPLATAARNAGHEVFVATIEENVPFVEGVGLPPVPVAVMADLEILARDGSDRPAETLRDPVRQMRLVGRWYARMARGSMDGLTRLTESWRPDLVVGGRLAYAGQLIAARLGVPYVRHPWGLGDWGGYDVGGAEELASGQGGAGSDPLPAPALALDICPPALVPEGSASAEPGQLLRWIPANLQRRLEPWMYTKGERRRICVTTGTRVTEEKSKDENTFDALGRNSDFLRELAATAARLDAEIVVAAPDDVARRLREELPDVRAGWIPLDVLAPTCDLIVSHGGTNTSMVALNAGVPQLNITKMYISEAQSTLISDFGAGLTIPVAEAGADRVEAACEELLSRPAYAKRAREGAADMAAMPSPAAVVGKLEDLAAA
ncbi:nucleotide disphospho-sugar-binding domain-containing protein [Streptomyces cyaneofuscatus]|uniref:nucleotide disphospho-sugar-binding domain-containing protein n=1 Tax=Streptomyces cyaneofuscatus TaxID=66883 RepID=UPI00382189B0